MLGFFSNRQKCYCAFCKTPRVIFRKRKVNLFNFVAAIFGAAVAMYALWQQFDPRVVILFVAFLALGEAFVQVRWRLNLVCKECGFDPILYLRDPNKASEKVKNHLERRKQDPVSLLKPALPIVQERGVRALSKHA